jgi:hypothetical protein
MNPSPTNRITAAPVVRHGFVLSNHNETLVTAAPIAGGSR